MKKNVASQAIGAQMVSSTDGSAFTGAVTVSVTGDAGTQATGSVGAGACTHEGNGYHTYAPAQAETNYDLVAFTFTGASAVPATVQIYTDFPQTGDSYALVNNVDGIETGWSLIKSIRVILSACGGKATGLDTGAPVYRNATDTKNRITAVTDLYGNRTTVTLDGS